LAPSTQQRYAVDSTNPHSRPSSKSTSKDQRAIARLANRTGNPTLDEQILAVPEGNPDNPYRGEAAPHHGEESDSDVSDDSGGGGKEESDDEEEEQPTKKKQKRVRREDRREWGLKSVRLWTFIFSPRFAIADTACLLVNTGQIKA